MKIKLLITGGTIDKTYDRHTGMLGFENTHLIKMAKRAKLTDSIISKTLFLKDSLDMNDDDRQLIFKHCLKSSQKCILISHGTDTIVKTAQLLGKNNQNKTIVLFGSITPYSVNNSDALFNFGFAMSAVQTQNSGVYIAMNGQIFDFDNVKKNQDLSVFQHLDD